MSENLSILDGELRRQFAPVDRLSVNNQGGGVSPWVISDFLDISTLSVSENGLYLAAEDDCDAYEEVEVSAELEEGDYRKITGKDPNLDPNNDYAVGLDENGNLTKEMIPAAIHIVVPPRKRKYEEGETIDFDGIHVYLMDGNNHRYTDSSYPTGEIPFSELMFPVTIAEGGDAEYHASSDLETAIPQPILFSQAGQTFHAIVDIYGDNWKYYFESPTIWYKQGASYRFLQCASTAEEITGKQKNWRTSWDQEEPTSWDIFGYGSLNKQFFTHNQKTVYYAYSSGGYDSYEWLSEPPLTGETIPLKPLKEDAWTVIYGDISEAGTESIPVQWMRSDGTILEDTFSIEVGEGGDPEPPQPDPWGGYADVSWGGHHYNLNRRIVPEVHYANGYLWQEGTSEYTVEQAASMGWLILIR